MEQFIETWRELIGAIKTTLQYPLKTGQKNLEYQLTISATGKRSGR